MSPTCGGGHRFVIDNTRYNFNYLRVIRVRVILSVFRSISKTAVIILLLMTMLANPVKYNSRVFIYSLYKGFARASFTREYVDSHEAENDEMRLLYEGKHSDFVKPVAYDVETAFDKLFEDFQYIPKDKVDIIIYPDYEEMSHIMALGSGSPALGAYYCGTIGIHDPKGAPVKQGLILHELTHYIIDYMTSGNVPAWFTEGAALYEEYRVYKREWAKSMDYSDFYSLKELEGDFYKLDEIKAYKESYLVVKYIVQNYGMEGVRKIIANFKEGDATHAAVKDALAIDADALFDKALESEKAK